MSFIKKIFWWGCVGAVFYFFMSYHLIFFGGTCKLLKKSKLTLNQTFFSTQGKTSESILDIDELREAGVGDILVEMGWLSEEEKNRLMAEYDGE